MKHKTQLLSVPALLAFSMSASAFTVDLFTEFQAVADVKNGAGNLSSLATDSTGTGLTTIMGGSRDIQVDAISAASDANGNGECGLGDLCSTMTISGGTLNFSNDAPVVGTGLVQWDGGDQSIALDMTGLGGLDLTDGGKNNAFEYTVIFSDLGYEFTLGLWTDADHFTLVELEANATDVAITETILFASLENSALCGLGSGVIPGIVSVTCGGVGGNQTVDMSNLGAMQLEFNTGLIGTSAIDLIIGSIVTVPEPAPLGLLGAGMFAAGMARYGRRRKSKA